MASLWFYRTGSEEVGPVSSGEVRSLAKVGKILPSTPIRKSDDAKWIKAGRIKGLFDGIPVQPEEEEDENDPLIAMTSQAASSVASATGSAASAIGGAVSGWLERRKGNQSKEELPTPESQPSEPSDDAPAWLSKFTLDDQPADVVTKVVGKVGEILMQGEELTYVAIQNKPVVNWTPDCIALTDKRFPEVNFSFTAQYLARTFPCQRFA